jgi:hypothetical protein
MYVGKLHASFVRSMIVVGSSPVLGVVLDSNALSLRVQQDEVLDEGHRV